MNIRTCNCNQDILELAECAKEIWNEYFISIISQEQIDYMVNKFQSYSALKKAIEEEGYTYFLAYEETNVVGYCGIRIDGERLFLSKLYIKKEMRGKSLSSKLLNMAITFAKEHHLTAVYLTCNKYNTNSLDIYKYKNFKIIDEVKTDIGHEFIMDDYILQLGL